jgi:predicted O-methyltransferase YrrM
MTAAASRSVDLVDRLLADPPAVHAMALGDAAEIGVWSTERSCYRFIAEQTQAGDRTLETGSGLSTVLLVALGARHICVTPSHEERDRILGYCATHDIPTTDLDFRIGCSDDVLPRLDAPDQLDLVLVDGNHGFPAPMIDWYYAGSRLRAGGVLVVDDVALPAVAHLCLFVDRDRRFEVVARTDKWHAYRRVDEGLLRQDWFDQPLYPAPVPTDLKGFVLRAVAKMRRTVKR